MVPETDSQGVPLRLIGWIYFIGAPEVNRIKVGYTGAHPNIRMISLRACCPVDLEPVGVLRGSRSTEKLIHERLLNSRWKSEWYTTANSIVTDFVRDHALPWPAPDNSGCALTMNGIDASKLEWEIFDRIETWFRERRRSNP